MPRVAPTVVYHADWSKDEHKRWFAKAVLGDAGRYIASVAKKVGSVESLIPTIRSEVGNTGCAVVGFDFPIGVPAFYAHQARIRSFKNLLPQLGKGKWKEFYTVCREPSEISVYRPFYPDNRYGGRKQEHLFRALGAPSMEHLLRACERRAEKVKKACCLFWTLGGNQVGKAAIDGWQWVLAPALQGNDSIRFWPFDGDLDSLLMRGNVVVAETYPAECYGWFSKEPLPAKGDMENRKGFAASLLHWAEAAHVRLEDSLKSEIGKGFPNGEDAFDAVVGLFGILEVLMGNRPSGEPDEPAIQNIEGWILGRTSAKLCIPESATTPKTIRQQLGEYGQLLHEFLVELPEHEAITDTLDYILGALYGLTHANRVGFADRLTKYVSVYRPHLADYALKVPKSEAVNALWTAGFYFNSGIQRLASAFDRIPRLLGAQMKKRVGEKVQSTSAKERMAEVNPHPCGEWETVYDEVNAFKHSPEGRAAGRTVTMNDALLAFGQMLTLLSDSRAALTKRYGR